MHAVCCLVVFASAARSTNAFHMDMHTGTHAMRRLQSSHHIGVTMPRPAGTRHRRHRTSTAPWPVTITMAAPLGMDGPIEAEGTLPLPLQKLDELVVSRGVRLANHAAAISSLACFGLVSMSMAMPSTGMPAGMATLASVITKNLGTTSNAQFSLYFATSITPASYVFLIWPVIAAVQAITLAISILRLSVKPSQAPLEALSTIATGEALSQSELASLSVANLAATLWLFVSSNALPGALPLASFLTLPLVPLFSGYPLRSKPTPSALYKPVLQIFSSFTTIASCLALAVELQYGGRVPFLAGRAELCGCIFLSLVGGLVSLPNRSLARKAVTSLALSGVVARRIASGLSAALLLSPSFLGASALLGWSAVKLVVKE
eukprot:CAMPEP_0119475682 /NCGR_PEP_ID=MMETSP1344-20130328/6477_1 /TAXON_ID=236787 /ORGANISM="Florenciella parvula, Strain CCMP2471" /LENGTH=376 /DNA_ID=CAMNT_0007509257 /DNA_START=70 /DNA_END=1200 /DNA_ORIENTATION=+